MANTPHYFWYLSRVVFRRLWHNRLGSLVTIAAVALSVAVFIGISYAARQSINSFGEVTSLLAGENAVMLRPARGSFLLSDLPPLFEHFGPKVKIQPLLEVNAILEGCAQKLAVKVRGVDLLQFARVKGAEREGPSKLDNIFIAAALRSAWRCTTGTLYLTPMSAKVTGALSAFPSRNGAIERSVVFVDIGVLAEALQQSDRVSALVLQGISKAEARSAAIEVFGQAAVTVEDRSDRKEQAGKLLGAFRFNIQVMVIMTLLVAVFVVFASAQLSALGQRAEVSIQATLGASPLLLYAASVIESGILGVIGSFAGVVLGRPLTTLVASTFLQSASELYLGAGTNGVSIGVPSFATMAFGFLVGVIVALLGALVPARQAMRTTPGMQAGVAKRASLSGGRARMAARLAMVVFGLIACLLLEQRARAVSRAPLAHLAAVALIIAVVAATAPALRLVLALLHFFNLRSRALFLAHAQMLSTLRLAATAVSAAAIGLSLLVGLGIMVSSFRLSLGEWLTQSLQADLFIRSALSGEPGRAAYLPAEVSAIARALPEVASVAEVHLSTIDIQGKSLGVQGIDFAIASRYQTYQVLAGSFAVDSLTKSNALLLTESAARRLHAVVGASIAFACPNGEAVRLPVIGITRDYASERGSLLISQKLFVDCFGAGKTISLALYLRAGESAAKVRAALEAATSRLPLRITLNAELRENILSLFDRTFLITQVLRYVVAVICSLAMVLMLVQILWERRDELRTLTTLGAAPSVLMQSLIMEAALLCFVALILGWGAGIWLAHLLIDVVNPLSFGWSLKRHLLLWDLMLPVIVLGAALILFLPLGMYLQRRLLTRHERRYE